MDADDAADLVSRVLYRDENTGATEVVFDPNDPNILYASLWSGRQAPWEVNGSFEGPAKSPHSCSNKRNANRFSAVRNFNKCR